MRHFFRRLHHKNCWVALLSSLTLIGVSAFGSLLAWSLWYTLVVAPFCAAAVLGGGLLATNGASLFVDQQKSRLVAAEIDELERVTLDLLEFIAYLADELEQAVKTERRWQMEMV